MVGSSSLQSVHAWEWMRFCCPSPVTLSVVGGAGLLNSLIISVSVGGPDLGTIAARTDFGQLTQESLVGFLKCSLF